MLRQQINGGFGIQQEVSQVPVVSTDLKFVCVPQTLSSSSENPVPQQLFSPAPSSPITSFDYLDSVTPDDIPEFKQYNKEKYESAKSGSRRKRKPTREECDTASSLDGYEEEDGNSSVSHAEFRRQIHIQSEQRRRAEIKDGFEQLRRQLPFNTNGRKMSKATLLQKTVTHLKNMKSKENFLFDEINRLHQYITYLSAELEREKKMNAIYQQQETLDKIYAIGL